MFVIQLKYIGAGGIVKFEAQYFSEAAVFIDFKTWQPCLRLLNENRSDKSCKLHIDTFFSVFIFAISNFYLKNIFVNQKEGKVFK